ncbi:glutamyl-tRNA(Gln) amidotransferase [Colletotrichum limetticola]|uniref:Glutamyl-tRNA(Gln) amidotransferase n=1 Tax=Colletotrichum limetticola TaxID=1209924 RepID=A0ABQ9QBB3_9PEZI|nr:glutamyl-tRNA(Gln) amidotransferase [Colletotrichum limetticola]
MLVRKVPVLAPVNNPEFGASDSSPSTHAPLLDYFPPTREARIRCHQSATSSPSPAVVRIKTVIELGTKAFVIRGQPNYKTQPTDSPNISTLSCFVISGTSNLRDDLEEPMSRGC